MSVKTVGSLEEVKEDVLNSMESKIVALMEDIAFEIQSKYESVIDMFYGSYSPSYYDRTFDTYFGSSGASDIFGGVSVQRTGDGWNAEAGITVSSEGLSGYYHDPVDYVFPRTWAQGIHGTALIGQSTPPKTMMDQWFETFKSGIYAFIRGHGF